MYEFTFDVKPMRFYKEWEQNLETVEVGDVVLANVQTFYQDKIWLKVGMYDAEMELEDVNSYDSIEKNTKFIVAQIGRNILARVKDKQDNVLVLERRSVVEETIENLKSQIGETVAATVESVEPYGAFADIGNGIRTLIKVREMSKSRHYDLPAVFREGDIIQVKLLDFDPETSYFTVSRKQAYESNLKKEMYTVTICSHPLKDQSGIFVEFNPATSGIMDIPENMDISDFTEGRKMNVHINKIVEKGFRCSFVGFVD